MQYEDLLVTPYLHRDIGTSMGLQPMYLPMYPALGVPVMQTQPSKDVYTGPNSKPKSSKKGWIGALGAGVVLLLGAFALKKGIKSPKIKNILEKSKNFIKEIPAKLKNLLPKFEKTKSSS